MTELAEPTGVEAEQRTLLGRNLVTAGHLMGHATAFFFLAFLFAYIYLRSLNGNGQFHPRGVNPPVVLGTVVAALLVASAAAIRLAFADQKANRHTAVRIELAAGLALGLGALAAQVALWATVGFGPNSGGYASVFVGWTGFYFVFVLLTLLWVETQLATALRYRDQVLAGLDALAYYWAFLAGVGVLTWVVLYLITP
jgi:heme/copper-type cytochrome/quinol oxidase subunit 3